MMSSSIFMLRTPLSDRRQPRRSRSAQVIDVRASRNYTSTLIACGEYGMTCSVPSQAIKLLVSSSHAALGVTVKDGNAGIFFCKVTLRFGAIAR